MLWAHNGHWPFEDITFPKLCGYNGECVFCDDEIVEQRGSPELVFCGEVGCGTSSNFISDYCALNSCMIVISNKGPCSRQNSAKLYNLQYVFTTFKYIIFLGSGRYFKQFEKQV